MSDYNGLGKGYSPRWDVDAIVSSMIHEKNLARQADDVASDKAGSGIAWSYLNKRVPD